MTDNHDWITVHRVLFVEGRDGAQNPLAAPAGAQIWRSAPEALPVGPDGARPTESRAWGAMGIYASEIEARAVLEDPEAHLPYLTDTVEAWHVLVAPYAHHGTTNWRGSIADGGTTMRIASEDPTGPLVVITSAGYVNPGPKDLPRIEKFQRRVDDVLAFYSTLEGNLRRAVYSSVPVDGREGYTFTLWRDDQAMAAAAYRPGVHKTQMDENKADPMFDHSSFTRGRVVASLGTWDGENPVEHAQ